MMVMNSHVKYATHMIDRSVD